MSCLQVSNNKHCKNIKTRLFVLFVLYSASSFQELLVSKGNCSCVERCQWFISWPSHIQLRCCDVTVTFCVSKAEGESTGMTNGCVCRWGRESHEQGQAQISYILMQRVITTGWAGMWHRHRHVYTACSAGSWLITRRRAVRKSRGNPPLPISAGLPQQRATSRNLTFLEACTRNKVLNWTCVCMYVCWGGDGDDGGLSALIFFLLLHCTFVHSNRYWGLWSLDGWHVQGGLHGKDPIRRQWGGHLLNVGCGRETAGRGNKNQSVWEL